MLCADGRQIRTLPGFSFHVLRLLSGKNSGNYEDPLRVGFNQLLLERVPVR
jgi:hypothetical protein